MKHGMSEGNTEQRNPGEDLGEFLGYVGGWRWMPFIAAFVAVFFSAVYMFISRNSFKNIEYVAELFTLN